MRAPHGRHLDSNEDVGAGSKALSEDQGLGFRV